VPLVAPALDPIVAVPLVAPALDPIVAVPLVTPALDPIVAVPPPSTKGVSSKQPEDNKAIDRIARRIFKGCRTCMRLSIDPLRILWNTTRRHEMLGIFVLHALGPCSFHIFAL